MTKVEVVTQTTYVIDLPIDSFDEILESKMPIAESDKIIIDFLSESLGVGIDKVITVRPVGT